MSGQVQGTKKVFERTKKVEGEVSPPDESKVHESFSRFRREPEPPFVSRYSRLQRRPDPTAKHVHSWREVAADPQLTKRFKEEHSIRLDEEKHQLQLCKCACLRLLEEGETVVFEVPVKD